MFIDLARAEKLTQNWQAEYPIKAFEFHPSELRCVASESNVEEVRFYMGLEGPILKLMIVGVDPAGRDITGDEENSQVYDFALPCPPTCDIDSPLYHEEFTTDKRGQRPAKKVSPEPKSSECSELIYQVPLSQAQNWASAWQEAYSIKAFLFKVSNIDLLAGEEGFKSIRIYGGLDAIGNVTMIIVGVDAEGNDIIDENSTDPNILMNIVHTCPFKNGSLKFCDVNSPLYFS